MSYVIIFSLGTVLASFMGLLVDRWFSISSYNLLITSSYCNICRTKLNYRQMIPIISWVYYHGKCPLCKFSIPLAYPLSEIACGIGVAVAFYYEAWLCPLFCLMFWLAWMDWRYQQLPILGLLILGALSLVSPLHLDSALCLTVLSLVCQRLKFCASGDIVLMTLVGLWLPLMFLGFFLIATGIMLGGSAMILQQRKLPLTPALFLALWLTLSYSYTIYS